VQEGVTEIGVVRVDVPAAAAAQSLFESTYADDGATFPADIAVPAGTTDYTQFVLAAEDAGAAGIMLALGGQEAIQVARAGQQLGTDLRIAGSLGSFSYADVVDLGEIANQMTFVWPFPPATADLPVYRVLRADLAASGEDALQPEQLKTGAMMSWIAMYGLVEMIRDAGLTDLSRESITALVEEAEDVPMLGIFGDATWTPALDYEGVWTRVGIDRYTYWTWDPGAEWDGQDGNFVLGGEISFTDAMCGSPLGAPAPC
jgi:branched-chain amino acid transport system substrate-binding protein